MASAAQVTIPPWINRSLTFDPPRDLVPVAHLVDTPMVLIVVGELRGCRPSATSSPRRGPIAAALNYGSTGVGTISHLVMESLKLAADIDVVHVPYRGAAPALNDLHAGQVQGCSPARPRPRPWWRRASSGRSPSPRTARSPLLPDVPTMAEAGWPTAEVVVWAGVMAPAGVPRTIIRKLERAFVEAALTPEVRDRLVMLGADPVGRARKAFAEVLEKDLALWQRVALASGVKVE